MPMHWEKWAKGNQSTFSVPPASLSFGGTDEQANAATADGLSVIGTASPANLSFFFWVKCVGDPTQYDTPFGCAQTASWNNNWGFFFNSSTELRFWCVSYTTHKVATLGSYTWTNWNSVGGTLTTGAGGSTMKLYINGVLDNSYTTGTEFTNWITAHLIRLGYLVDSSSFFVGKVCQVGLWTSLLTATDMGNLHALKGAGDLSGIGSGMKLYLPIKSTDSATAAGGIFDLYGKNFTCANMESGDLDTADFPT